MLRLYTPAAALPLSVIEARAHVRQDQTTDDSTLTGLLGAMAEFAETECGRSLVAKRWKLTLDAWPYVIRLERGPVRRVVSVRYLDDAGDWQTLATTEYVVDLDEMPARIVPAWGTTWPSTLPQLGPVVEVLYDAGDLVSFTADATLNTITLAGPWPDLAVNDVVRLSNSGGALPAGLSPLTDYYVKTAPGGGVYTLSATAGGAAIDITGAGSGTHYVGAIPDGIRCWMLARLGTLYDNRSGEMSLKFGPNPWLDRLLDGSRVQLP